MTLNPFNRRQGLFRGRAVLEGVLVVVLATLAHSQNSQFTFDLNGNLLVQSTETSAPPQILGQPQNRIVVPGETTSFFVVAADTRALTYQWQFNGTNIDGANSDALLLQNATTNNEGEYRVVLTNPSGSITSAPALLMMDSDADGLPDSWERTFFGNLANNATGDFDHDGVANRTEFLDGSNPTNSASALFRITLLSDGGSVIKTPDAPSYTNGDVVTVTATPTAALRAWTGDVATRSNSITLVMTNNKTLFAHFGPIVLSWANGAGGDWNTAANWAPALVPASNDTVIITGSATVTLDTSADCADVTLGDANGTPTLNGSGTLTVRGNLFWNSGTMAGSGRTIIEAGGTLDMANPSTVVLNTRTLENGGTATWTGAGNLPLLGGAVITNRAGALFQVQGPGGFAFNANENGRIDNAGTFRKSNQTGATVTGLVRFNNYSIVEIQSGTLSLDGGGTHSGSFTVPVDTMLALGGTHNGGAGSSITGAGQFRVNGGAANLAGLVNVSGSNIFNGGTANLTGNYICTNNTVTISGGTVNFSGTELVSPAVVTLSSGELGGSGTVTVLNAMNWTGGTMSGSGRTIIPAGVTLSATIPGGASLNGRALENGGTVLWTGAGFLAMNNGAVVTNRVGALFEMQNAVTIVANNGLCHFDNAGTFRKSINSGTTAFPGTVNINNSGTVDIRLGILQANGGYVSSSNALLNCSIGGTTAGTGYGQLQVGGTVTLNGSLRVDLINGFVPATNDSFAVVTAGTRNGAFNNFFFPSNAVTMQLSNTANSAVAKVTDVFITPQPAPLPPGVISWWRAEGDALDAVSTNHGEALNGAAYTTGMVDRAFLFDGVDDYISIPDSPTLRPVSVTLEAWVKFFATNGIRIVMGKPLGNNTTFDSYGLALQDGTVIAAICDNSGFGPFLSNPSVTLIGQWYHLAFTFDDANKQQALYVNGALVASGLVNKTMAYDSHPLLIGADLENGALSFFHNGLIDEASIYNRALATEEIAAIYAAGAGGKQIVREIFQPFLLTPEIIGTDLKLSWTAVSNAAYRLEFKADLTNPSSWSAVPGDTIATGSTASRLEPLTLGNRYYRIRVLP